MKTRPIYTRVKQKKRFIFLCIVSTISFWAAPSPFDILGVTADFIKFLYLIGSAVYLWLIYTDAFQASSAENVRKTQVQEAYEKEKAHEKKARWLKQKKGKRRYPRGKGLRVTHAEFPRVRGELDYVESRKNVYVPEYYELVRGNAVLTSLAERIASGEDIVVYDFDGPRTKSGDVTCEVVTLELLQEKIDDVSRPFGHGYIIAGILAGIVPSQYV